MEIRLGGLDDAAVIRLLEEHLQSMTLHSPPESIHALDLAGLKRPEITFWSAWQDDELLGCGALKELDARHGEIKSMRTVASRQRQGVGAMMLQHLLEQARARGYRRLSLETGSMEAFAPARKLYQRYGFTYCGPFADYVPDPHSVFMTRELSPA